MTKEMLKADMHTNRIDEAITTLFGKCVDVNWVFCIAGTAFGTVEIDGKAFDWFENHDSFRFIPA